jgi:hypothetical protein
MAQKRRFLTLRISSASSSFQSSARPLARLADTDDATMRTEWETSGRTLSERNETKRNETKRNELSAHTHTHIDAHTTDGWTDAYRPLGADWLEPGATFVRCRRTIFVPSAKPPPVAFIQSPIIPPPKHRRGAGAGGGGGGIGRRRRRGRRRRSRDGSIGTFERVS